jgi:hypothetical protein
LAPIYFSHHRDRSEQARRSGTARLRRHGSPSKDFHTRSFPLLREEPLRVRLTLDVLGPDVAGYWVPRSLLGVWRPRGLPIRTGTLQAVPPSSAFGSRLETDSGLVFGIGYPTRRHLPWVLVPFSALRMMSRTQGLAFPRAKRLPLSVFRRPSGVLSSSFPADPWKEPKLPSNRHPADALRFFPSEP